MPHGMMRGPDGKVYVNEQGRVFRFDPLARRSKGDGRNRHRRRAGHQDALQFSSPFQLHLRCQQRTCCCRWGAPSDQCMTKGRQAGRHRLLRAVGRRLQSRGASGAMPIWETANGRPNFTHDGAGPCEIPWHWCGHSSGTLLQGENSEDFAPADTPFEELNVLRQGAHYGWPYCYDMTGTNPAWAPMHVMDCSSSAHTKPVRLLPPHGAPLSMLYYDGAMFPQAARKVVDRPARLSPGRLAHWPPLPSIAVAFLWAVRNAHYDMYAGPNGDETVSHGPMAGPASEAFCSRRAGIMSTACIRAERRWDWRWPKTAPIWVAGKNTNATILRDRAGPGPRYRAQRYARHVSR